MGVGRWGWGWGWGGGRVVRRMGWGRVVGRVGAVHQELLGGRVWWEWGGLRGEGWKQVGADAAGGQQPRTRVGAQARPPPKTTPTQARRAPRRGARADLRRRVIGGGRLEAAHKGAVAELRLGVRANDLREQVGG